MINLKGHFRTKVGTAYSRRLRLEDKFPAVICKKNSSSILIVLNQNELLKKFNKTANFRNRKIKIFFPKKSIIVNILDIQFHSFQNRFLHIDFLFVKKQ